MERVASVILNTKSLVFVPASDLPQINSCLFACVFCSSFFTKHQRIRDNSKYLWYVFNMGANIQIRTDVVTLNKYYWWGFFSTFHVVVIKKNP